MRRNGQRGAIELAVGGDGQAIQAHPGGRAHELRQFGRQMGAQRVGVDRVVRHDVGHQPFVAGAVFAHDHGAAAHARMLAQTGFDLADFDAETADLHLAIAAADEFDVAVGQAAHEVAGAIEARAASRERIGDEAFRVELRAIAIAAREAASADEQFADEAIRNGFEAAIENVESRVGDRAADRHGAVVGPKLRGMRQVAAKVVDSVGP